MAPKETKEAKEAREAKEAGLAIWEQIRGAKDDGGRARAELFLKLPSKRELPDYYQEIAEPMDLKTIKDKLGRGEYESLGAFEHDMHLVFDNAKSYNKPRSEIYDDAVYLQRMFKRVLKERSGVAQAPKPAPVKADDSSKIDERLETRNYLDAMTVAGVKYEVGDFVYIENPEDATKPAIVQIHELWSEKGTRNKGFIGCPFMRPEQTFHVPTRKFYVNEVFRTRSAYDYSFDDVQGKCCVLYVKDYVKGHPEGFDDKDVYVCESRYVEADKAIEPIKNWKSALPKKQQANEVYHPPLVGEPRKALTKTVPSVFATEATTEPAAEEERTVIRLPSLMSPLHDHTIRIRGQADDHGKRHAATEADSGSVSKRIRLSVPGEGSTLSPATAAAPAESDGRRGEKETGFIRWTMQETLALAQAVARLGTRDWSRVRDACADVLRANNHDTTPKLRERYKLLIKNMPPGGVLEPAIQAAIAERVEESSISAWLAEYWKRPGVIPEPPPMSMLEMADATSGSCNFEECEHLSFASSEALFTHIRAAHRPEFVAKYGSRTRSEMFGRFLPVREHVPPTYINEGVLSKEFVEQYAHTSDGKLLWFSRPPLDVLPPVPRPVHSDAYVRFRQEQAQAEAEAEERRRADVAENAEQESAAQERYREHIEAATASNWRSLLNTLMMAGQRQAT